MTRRRASRWSALAVVIMMLTLQACGGGGGGGGGSNGDPTGTDDGPVAPTPPVEPPAFVSNSSSLWLDETANVLWLLSPDDRRLVKLDAGTLQELGHTSLQQRPLALSHDGDYLVLALSSTVQRFDLRTETLGRAVPIPCGDPTAIVTGRQDDRAWLSCVNDDAVLGIRFGPTPAYRMLSITRPAALAIKDETLYVSEEATGVLHLLDVAALDGLPDWDADSPNALAVEGRRQQLDPGPRKSASQFSVLHAAADYPTAIGVYQLVENRGDRQRSPDQGGYGSVFDGEPRIDARVLADCGDRYTRFDGGLRVFSGPSAAAYGDGLLWLVNTYTQNVAVLRCTPGSQAAGGELPLVAHFRVAAGAGGIALSSDGRTAYVDNGFDYSVSRLELSDDTLSSSAVVAQPALTRTRTTGDRALSRAAEQGRKLFFDARNIHLTPSGIVSCASCHPRAGADGLSWFLHTPGVPRKFRNTPPAWAARSAAAPFHWAGDFADAANLVTDTIRELMEGDALLIDTSAVAAYMEEAPAPAAPWQPPWRAASLARGEELFAARCAGCHTDPLLTDAQARKVVTDSLDPDGVMPQTDTPTLLAVRASAPYLHDGRAGDLRSVLTIHNPQDLHAQVADLDAAALDDLLAFLLSL